MASKKLGSLRLLRRALGHFRYHWTGYWRIVAVTALPVGFLGLFMGASSDTTLSAYLALGVSGDDYGLGVGHGSSICRPHFPDDRAPAPTGISCPQLL
ncbi:hypothetical protein IPG36_06505 [bacterium]|nr:MAG: hypothetical protein IPG36_06505 [bacterium]